MATRYMYINQRRKQKMESNQLINLLTIILGIMIGILCILCVTFLVLKLKSREHKEKKVVKQQEENAKA